MGSKLGTQVNTSVKTETEIEEAINRDKKVIRTNSDLRKMIDNGFKGCSYS